MIRPPPTSTLFPYTTLFRFSFHRYKLLTWQPAASAICSSVHSGLSASAASALAFLLIADLPLVRCAEDRKSTRLNSSHLVISYAVFCLKKKITIAHTHSCTSC